MTIVIFLILAIVAYKLGAAYMLLTLLALGVKAFLLFAIVLAGLLVWRWWRFKRISWRRL